MLFEIGGHKIKILDLDDRTVLHEQADGYERASLAAWAAIVKPGWIAIDVGAYTGLFSILAAKRGAHVVAMEPMPANRWRLGCNIAMNKVAVEIFDCAASDHIGQTTLHFNPKVPLTTGASLEAGNDMHRASIKVPRVTIDSLALTNVGAIKIDVERHEPAVLRGAMNTITRDRPPMLIETLDDNARVEMLSMLPSYRVAAILDGRNTLFIPT